MDMLSRFSLVLLAFVLTVTFASAQDQEVKEIKEARHLIEVDQTGKAITLLDQATKTNPAVPALWYHLGMAQLKAKQRDLAAKSFDKGIALDPKEPLNYVGRGNISMLENNAQKAQLDFDQALSLTKSKNVPVLRAVSEAYLIDSKLAAKAVTLLNKAKSIDDHDPLTFVVLGDALLAQNNGGGAVSAYERAAGLDNKLALPHYKIGLVYLRSRNYPSAQEAFTKAIQIDPGYTLAYKEQGELYYQLKDGVNAAKSYEKYLSLTENPAEGQLRYAFFLFMAKDFEKAKGIFKELTKKPDVSITALRYYAHAATEAGDTVEAGPAFEQYFAKAKPEEVEAADYTTYAKLLQRMGKDSLALVQFEKSIAKEGKQPDIIQGMGETYFKTKRYPEAIKAYETLATLKPKLSSKDLHNLGRAYYITEAYQKADTTYQKLIELQPTMTVGYSWLARSKAAQDSTSEAGLAKPYYEKVIEVGSLTPDKSKNDLILAYEYLGYYYYLKNDEAASTAQWKKLLEIDPYNVKATEFMNALKANKAAAKAAQKPKPKK
jgi:tetratricopeptide (TPR) repeat protein